MQGVTSMSWTSPILPDYLAQLRAALFTDTIPLLASLLGHTRSISRITSSWADLPQVDNFWENGSHGSEMEALMQKNK